MSARLPRTGLLRVPRPRTGGFLIKDSKDQSGGGALIGGDAKVGRFLTGLDLWITKSANLLIRAGVAF